MTARTLTEATARSTPVIAANANNAGRVAGSAFMGFLYLDRFLHLENLRHGWHLIAIAGEMTFACIASSAHQESSMLDIAMLTLGGGFFILSVGYAYACERL